MDWINLIGWACITALWIASEPTIRLRYWFIGDKFNLLTRLSECAMCSGFWMYFLWHLVINFRVEIIGASIVAILSEFIVRKLETWTL